MNTHLEPFSFLTIPVTLTIYYFLKPINMATRNISIAEAKQIDMVDFLKNLGHTPQMIRNNDHWYLSPLREEKSPSFKVRK